MKKISGDKTRQRLRLESKLSQRFQSGVSLLAPLGWPSQPLLLCTSSAFSDELHRTQNYMGVQCSKDLDYIELD